MRKFSFLFTVGISFLLFSVFGTIAVPAETIKIGFFSPFTGPLAGIGNYAIQGAQFAVDEINSVGGIRGKKLDINYYDTASGPDASKNLAFRAVDVDKVSILVGDLLSSNTLALMEVAKTKKIPLISYGAAELMTYEYRDPYFFKLSPGIPNYVSAIVGYATKVKNVKRFGVLAAKGKTEKLYSDTLKDYFKRSNIGQIVGKSYFDLSTTDFTKLITDIRGKRPDGLFLIATSETAGLIVKQTRKIGFDVPIFSASRLNEPDKFIKHAGGYAQNFFMPSSYYPEVFKSVSALNFVKNWAAVYNALPYDLPANTYDLIRILATVMEKYGTSPRQIEIGLKEHAPYMGVSGDYHFLPYGSIIKDMVITEWENDVIKPAQYYKY